MIRMLGGLIGCADLADTLASKLEADLDHVRSAASHFPQRPRAYFEEWDARVGLEYMPTQESESSTARLTVAISAI